ncbi:zinc finger homeobox protein 4-like isoform X1 [Silurus meridionalis]|uniref:Uncharacterized protein n=1 Tax=Silurus meridionalis TaxID=175797 RepID=A0A8T0AJF4_SILME|nr:zinc finger homeobox protein 4-like isoform X1 [Silurus meridionalis]KAF7691755.1 hypothetical protein HF521_010722 [Silurus meridionalis]KAI5092163.1 zinc finger homeobox protein 4 isoform X1 [Silurus meridionalis]
MTDCMCRGCYSGSGASLHYIPKDPETRQKWIDFIYRNRTAPTLKNLDRIRICSAHFTEECFTNYRQKMMGFGKRLILRPNAVPTIAVRVELMTPSRTRQEKVEETTAETRLCPLCQRCQKDSEALACHLTKKHSVHPACLENLLVSAPYAIRSSDGVTESSPENINGTSQQKSFTESALIPVQQDASSQEHDTSDKSGVANKGSGDSDSGASVENDPNIAAAKGNVSHPFKCHACLKYFTHKSALNVHYNSATHIQKTRTEARNNGDSTSPILAYPYVSSKPYQCDVCHVSYFYPFGLENHLKSVLHQSRTRKAGITAAISKTNTGTGITVANLGGSTVPSAKNHNCVPQAEKVRIQPASSSLPNPVLSAQAVPAVLPLLTLAPNSVPHTLVPSVFPAPGTSTTQLIPQPQMLMPLIVNGLQTHGPTPDGPRHLLQQAVNVLGLSSSQHVQELCSSETQSHLATTIVSSASQTTLETIKSADVAGVKIEIKEEPCDREVSPMDPCTADAISQGLKQEWDGIENSRTTNITFFRIDGGDKQQSKAVSMGENSKRHPPDANKALRTEDLQSSHVTRTSPSKCNPSNAKHVLTSSRTMTCSSLPSGPPVLTEFQSEVLWAFLESQNEADSVIPPREDCETLGRVVGLTEDEVRNWLANTHRTKERHCADVKSCYERRESTEDDEDDLMIDESGGIVIRSTTDFLSDEDGGDKHTTVDKKRKRVMEMEDSDEDS